MNAQRLVECRPDEADERLQVPDGSYAVVMTHSFQDDRGWLRYLLPKRLNYLGVLGPRARTERLLADGPVPEFIRSPIGLAIGADGPEEIAVSIVAELVKTHRTPTFAQVCGAAGG